MKSLLLTLALVLTLAATSLAGVKGYEMNYMAGDTLLRGYLAVNEDLEGRRPGVLVVHEWWGLNAYARERARMLAELGYTALAVDMYGEGKTADHPREAGQFAMEVRQNLPLAQERFTAAMAMLQQHPSVNPDQLAASGYCFGGSVVLEMARTGLDINGVAAFHASLATENPAQPGLVRA
ncbi:dienelactone hydrolase family protein, partial [Geoalkalibacter halelectricus]|uniref:dienelactone hydrolase family protein n=1 Tax=Geoalkalibacter halelectricus TaxID=2847045 RepID=UPI003D23DC1B